MDRGSFLGVLLGVLLLAVAIGLGPNPRIFFHPASTIVVVGGVIAATLIRFPLDHVRYAFSIASRAFFTRAPEVQALVNQIVGLSQRARREGLLNMEKAMDVEGFLSKGLRMVVDQVNRDHIHAVLASELRATQDRHMQGQEIFRFIALSAPSFGMVGTLIGMVQLFAALKDPSNVGGAMALCLLSTLYGAVIAYLLAIPIAGKLELRSREELQLKQIMLEGVLGIQAEMHPTALEAQLNAFLAPRERGQERRARG
ncbi:flagellar motor protein MotP [Geothrix limicola]|uniref:Flagellar motor protein MotP n=1 Tax=Geothrix limicola TaxID=2927978 RepID=A0ABQ5QBA0_9BACT|nr:MotA/TolQ/ExbB proton channel family protein [Geothrix limicola]GLH71636.1 flagellar motor protein MotP [Geothrix limicola]HJV48819.1 MotA/TolQ/ExbB proton channel family protein [Geothrix sp.]